jgi:hypothetical protein
VELLTTKHVNLLTQIQRVDTITQFGETKQDADDPFWLKKGNRANWEIIRQSFGMCFPINI